MDEDLAFFSHTFVTTWLDYSKVIYLDMNSSVLRKFQLLPNTAAHLLPWHIRS